MNMNKNDNNPVCILLLLITFSKLLLFSAKVAREGKGKYELRRCECKFIWWLYLNCAKQMVEQKTEASLQ